MKYDCFCQVNIQIEYFIIKSIEEMLKSYKNKYDMYGREQWISIPKNLYFTDII